jgi:hypothetical protein
MDINIPEATSLAYLLCPPLHQQYQHYILFNCWKNYLSVTWMPKLVAMKLGM